MSGSVKYRQKPTVWLDYATSSGVDDKGLLVSARLASSQRKPRLVDFLETAHAAGAEKVMLTGAIPAESGAGHWLLSDTPNWLSADLRLTSPPNATFKNETTGTEVMVRLASEWFADVPVTPAAAREAWVFVADALKAMDENASMAYTPGRTGLALWKLSAPKNLEIPSLTSDIAEEIHATSGQHHEEHLVAGSSFSEHEDCVPLINPTQTPTINRFADVDGRFMFAAVGTEIGIGPGIRMKQDAASTMLFDEPFTRARYEVRFRVPEDWDTLGILGVQHENKNGGWYYPNRPGATGTTWCDGSEANLARQHGWDIQPLQAVAFQKAKPLDTFFARVVRARDATVSNLEIGPLTKKAALAALRRILLHAVGGFASTGRTETHIVDSAFDIPAEAEYKRLGDKFKYTQKNETARSPDFYHPEFAAQIWGRARARVLESPLAGTHQNMKGGALHVPPSLLIGINGDAIYTAHPPHWSLPVEHGGGDDGKPGRLRLEGLIKGTIPTPITLNDRVALRTQALENGPTGAWN